jgi:hypothetical protein
LEFSQTLKQRYSCRRFLDKAVDLDTLKDLISLASRVPSWGNTQPWKVYAAAGDTAQAIRADITELYRNQEPMSPDITMPPKFDSPLMDRYRQLGAELLTLLGIARDDKQKRAGHFANNFDAFGAPALVFWTIPQGETPILPLTAGPWSARFAWPQPRPVWAALCRPPWPIIPRWSKGICPYRSRRIF